MNIGTRVTQWGSNELSVNFIKNICIPSVMNYAKKNNYDYKLYTENISPKFGKNFLLSNGTYISCNKYFYSYYRGHENYDQIVYIDNDVYVFDNAEKLPLINNLSGIAEPEESICHDKFSKHFKIPQNIKYVNAGVLLFNNDTGKKIKNYFEKRFNQQKKGGWKNTDNGILNELIYIDRELEINLLNKKWNYMPHICKTIDDSNPNFLHFVGGQGKDFIKLLMEQSSNSKLFLEKLFW